MTRRKLRAALVTPVTGPLARFGREGAAALSLWANHAADLPPPWTGVNLEVFDANPDPETVTRAARILLPGEWKAAAFVGAGVEGVLAEVENLREDLLGPAQWTPSTAPEPDEGPDAA
jgi:hypothetical protein